LVRKKNKFCFVIKPTVAKEKQFVMEQSDIEAIYKETRSFKVIKLFLTLKKAHQQWKVYLFDIISPRLWNVGLWSLDTPPIFLTSIGNNLKLVSPLAPITRVYTRIEPYTLLGHTDLVDVHSNLGLSLGAPRKLHWVELELFYLWGNKEQQQQRSNDKESACSIRPINEFLNAMENRFRLSAWKKCIDWERMVVAGGSVSACCMGGIDITDRDMDVDIFLFGDHPDNFDLFETIINKVIDSIHSKCGYDITITKTKVLQACADSSRVHTSIVTFPTGDYISKLHFVNMTTQFFPTKEEIITHFDISACQICYDGEKVLATRACLESFATRTMMSYFLPRKEFAGDSAQSAKRLHKYAQRGWRLLLPHGFDESLLTIKSDKKRTRLNDVYTFPISHDYYRIRETFTTLITHMHTEL
jgi:hypothetical protein